MPGLHQDSMAAPATSLLAAWDAAQCELVVGGVRVGPTPPPSLSDAIGTGELEIACRGRQATQDAPDRPGTRWEARHKAALDEWSREWRCAAAHRNMLALMYCVCHYLLPAVN